MSTMRIEAIGREETGTAIDSMPDFEYRSILCREMALAEDGRAMIWFADSFASAVISGSDKARV